MSELKLTVPDVIEEFRDYSYENPSGGSLHIVLSDFNVDDGSVEFCRLWAIENGDADGERLANTLLGMSQTQRLRIAHRCWT